MANANHPFVSKNSAVMNQHTNSAFQTDEQHGYFTLNSREPGKYIRDIIKLHMSSVLKVCFRLHVWRQTFWTKTEQTFYIIFESLLIGEIPIDQHMNINLYFQDIRYLAP